MMQNLEPQISEDYDIRLFRILSRDGGNLIFFSPLILVSLFLNIPKLTDSVSASVPFIMSVRWCREEFPIGNQIIFW